MYLSVFSKSQTRSTVINSVVIEAKVHQQVHKPSFQITFQTIFSCSRGLLVWPRYLLIVPASWMRLSQGQGEQ